MNNSFFILSSSCKIVKGAKRSTLIDFSRNAVHFIANGYYELLKKMDRQSTSAITALVEEDSLPEYHKFLDFLISNEFGFLVEDAEQFPVISDQWEDHLLLKNAILDFDEIEHDYVDIFQQLDDLSCEELQLRIFKKKDLDTIKDILVSANSTSLVYVELLINYDTEITQEDWNQLIFEIPILSHIYLFGSPKNETVPFNKEQDDYHPLHFGNIYYLTQEMKDERSCGNISYEYLIDQLADPIFGQSIFRKLKKHNGCLYKKISIDKMGKIKNCPSLKIDYGNIKDTKLKNVLDLEAFKAFGNIKKDEIEKCKDCEFRYICTDCRAYLEKPEDLHSKPLKCGYDPYTNEWTDWSTNPLKTKAIDYYKL